MAAERSEPPRRSAARRWQQAFLPGASACSARTSIASSSEMPALIMVESWRVKMTSSDFDARGLAEKSPPLLRLEPVPDAPAAFFSGVAARPPSSTLRMIRSRPRSWLTASARSFAWIVPWMVLPDLSLAAYWKLATGLFLWVRYRGSVRGLVPHRDPQDLFQGRLAAHGVQDADAPQREHPLVEA